MSQAVRRLVSIAVLSVAAPLGGCTVGPDFKTPVPVAEPEHFQQTGTAASDAEEPAARWWHQLGDPVLDRLIEAAIRENFDLRAASANIAEAQAALDAAEARRVPTIDGAASYARSRESAAVNFGKPHGKSPDSDLTTGSFNLSWEIDLFGRVKRTIEAAQADEAAAEAERRQLQLLVIADLATAYIDLRGTQQRLAVAERNAATQKSTFDLTQTLSDAGRGTDLDIARARTQLETTEATIPPFKAAVVADKAAIAVLVGKAPEALDDGLNADGALPEVPALVAVGNPGSLLRRRPDVAQAEQVLAGATARIGVAIADLYPTVSLSAGIGVEALHPGDLTHRGAQMFQIGPAINFPVFDQSLYARVRGADASTDAALAQFQKTVLTALQETESALSLYREEQGRRSALAIAASASQRATELADDRFRFGAENFLTVLDAERTQLAAEDALAQSRILVAKDLITLYRALGGGWTDAVETADSAAPATP